MSNQTETKRSSRPRTFHRRRAPEVDLSSFDYDYRRVEILENFITETGRIMPRRRTGLSAKNQRRLALAIKRSREAALLPYTRKQVRR